MSNNSTASVNHVLLTAPFQLNIWIGTFLWLTGIIGCLANLLVFSSRPFRTRACSVYLLFAAFSDLFYFNFVLMTRIIQKGYRIPVVNRYIGLCKLRQFYTVWGNVFSFSLYAFATLDRLLSTERSFSKFLLIHSIDNHTRYSYKTFSLHVLARFSKDSFNFANSHKLQYPSNQCLFKF
jgi:hypothetical protein